MIAGVFADKSIKPKEKVNVIAEYLISAKISTNELLQFCNGQKDTVVASCIEALEIVSRQAPKLITKDVIVFSTQCLDAKAPRLKWESAKVLGNSAADHIANYKNAIEKLIVLTEFEGTVVRWSAAYALTSIVKYKSKWQAELLTLVQHLAEHEEKASISKMYKKALKELR